MQFKDIPLGVRVTGGITLVLALIGGTFAFTKNSYEQTIKTFEERIKLEEKKNSILESSINQSFETVHENGEKSLPLPSLRMAQESGNSEIKKMAFRLEELEKERRMLLSQISSKSVISLDPRSELSVLLSQLNSDDSEARSKALEGLFILKDPLSVKPLVEIFKNKIDEITKADFLFSLYLWHRFFLEIEEPAGIEFVVSGLESKNQRTQTSAFDSLRSKVDSVGLIDKVTPYLEEIALRSDSSTVRVKAKVLLEEFKEKKEKFEHYKKLIEDMEVSNSQNKKDSPPLPAPGKPRKK